MVTAFRTKRRSTPPHADAPMGHLKLVFRHLHGLYIAAAATCVLLALSGAVVGPDVSPPTGLLAPAGYGVGASPVGPGAGAALYSDGDYPGSNVPVTEGEGRG